MWPDEFGQWEIEILKITVMKDEHAVFNIETLVINMEFCVLYDFIVFDWREKLHNIVTPT